MQSVGNPIKKIISSTSSGNMKSIGLTENLRLTSPSNKSFSGSSSQVSIMKDDNSRTNNNIVAKFLGVQSAEFTRSVSITTTKREGQYYNKSGDKVDNIKDASKLIISVYSRTETATLEGGAGTKINTNSIDITENFSSTTFNVNSDDKASLEFVNNESNEISKTKAFENASPELKNLASAFASENKDELNGVVKKVEKSIYDSQNQSLDSDMKREKNMGNLSKYSPSPKN